MGVGNFQFSRDETERQEQMNFFRDMQFEVFYRTFCNFEFWVGIKRRKTEKLFS